MTDIHYYVAYSVPTTFAILALWALVAFVRNVNPGNGFWHLVAGIQIVLAVQVVLGGVLFFLGERPSSNGPQWLHYVYGGLFPGALLILAHRWARGERFRDIPWAVFGIVALVSFGLTLRALQTGLGID